jgi:IS30 family transposase
MKRLTYQDRKVLQKHLEQGMKIRAIGRAMGKSHTVILYELKAHRGDHLPYDADRAQGICERKQLNKGNVKKLEKNERLKDYVLARLAEGHSPEAIAGRLKAIPEARQTAGGYACHETVYAYIYDAENKREQYWKHLMRHRPKRGKRGARRSKKGGPVKNTVSISERPESVATRQTVGDWESDSMLFSKQPEILSVQTERKTRVVRITKCPDKTAAKTRKAVTGALGGEVEAFVNSITFDRGTEGAEHEQISAYLQADIYFCHPYCSWEKGGVENRNLCIRRYFPRNTDMSAVTDEMVYGVQERLNDRPMKCLGYRTPNEMMFFERFGRFPPLGQKIVLPENIPRKISSESGQINA